jgi:hypothetical protein
VEFECTPPNTYQREKDTPSNFNIKLRKHVKTKRLAFKDIVQKTSSLHRHLRLAGSVTDILPFLISASSAGFRSPESKYLEILEIDQIRGNPDE